MADKPDISIYIETGIGPMCREDGRYGYVLEHFPEGGPPRIRHGTGDVGDATETQAALAALRDALGRLRRPCHIAVHTAVRPVANALRNGWPKKWEQDGWRNAKGRQVAHRESWEDVWRLLVPHEYTVTTGPHSYRPWLQWELARKGGEVCLKDLGSSTPRRN